MFGYFLPDTKHNLNRLTLNWHGYIKLTRYWRKKASLKVLLSEVLWLLRNLKMKTKFKKIIFVSRHKTYWHDSPENIALWLPQSRGKLYSGWHGQTWSTKGINPFEVKSHKLVNTPDIKKQSKKHCSCC